MIMHQIQTMRGLLREANANPLTAHAKLQTLSRIIRWQIASRAVSGPIIIPFISGTELAIPRDMPGAKGDVYFGVREIEEVGFILHFLRKDDLFGNIGANIGVIAVAAAGVCGANVVAIEPVKRTADALRRNVRLNQLSMLVEIHQIGAGATLGELNFSVDNGTENRVTLEAVGEPTPVLPLDTVFEHRTPTLMNIDVEGFEPNVIAGARRLLRDPDLKAVIVETNGLCSHYGLSQDAMHAEMIGHGFSTYHYNPLRRTLDSVEGTQYPNTIYARDLPLIRERLASAAKFEVLGRGI